MTTGRYVTANEAADILGVHRHTIRNLLKKGELKGELAGSTWVIERADLEEFAKTFIRKIGRPRMIRRRRSNAIAEPYDSLVAKVDAWAKKWGYKEDR